MCIDNDEAGKYLMTFQNLLCRVPKWNTVIVEEERKRIIERSGCNYLEDLITCVHIIQLKVLTCIRVGNKQKKIDISIPKLDHFIHKIYVHVARKVYMNIYLFEKNISPLQIQKNNRELETIVQECILTSIRESIPTEAIIRAYMDESVEQEEEVIIEQMEDPTLKNGPNGTNGSNGTNDPSATVDPDGPKESDESVVVPPNKDVEPPAIVPSIQNLTEENVVTRLSFNDVDSVLNESDKVQSVNAPKTIERLEEISSSRALQRRLEEEEADSGDDDNDRIKIHTDMVDLSGFDVLDEIASGTKIKDDVPMFEFEEL